MTWTLVKLRIRLNWNLLTKSWWRVIGTVLVSLYGLTIIGAIYLAMIALGLEGTTTCVAELVCLAGGIIMLAWFILPLAYLGMDPTLDPRNYSPYVAPTNSVVNALAWQGFASPGKLVMFLLLLAPSAYNIALGNVSGAALSATLAPIIVCIGGLTMRLLTTLMLIHSKHVTTIRTLTGILLLLIVTPMGLWINIAIEILTNSTNFNLSGYLDTAVNFAQWIPFVAPFAATRDTFTNNWIHLAYTFIVAFAWIWTVLRLWRPVVKKAMLRPANDARNTTALSHTDGLIKNAERFNRFLPLPVAAVVSRELRYYRTDSRYYSTLIGAFTLIFMGTGMYIVSHGVNMFMIYLALWGITLTSALLAVSIATDSTAWWMHVAAPIKGTHDRLGRFIANFIIAGPIVLIVSIILPLVVPSLPFGQQQRLFVFSIIAYCATAGTGLITSTFWLYPNKTPDSSLMTSNTQGQNFITVLVSILNTFVITLGMVIPLLSFYFIENTWIATLVAVSFAAVTVCLGIVLGGRIIDSRRAQMLAKISSWPGQKLRL